ncbi:MAG TPA: alpha/beta fold hydrolase [Ktedonobacteraceae bacterium]|nr:alpha/beta fold hydrolase [Ktedonobacteraceae bacterium]
MQTEERVQVAIENWAPRFLANGVDPNDFQRITKRVERWDDWSREWSAVAAMHERMGEEAEAQEYYQSAAYHYLHATITYHFGKFMFVHHPEELRAAHEKVVQTYRRALPYFDVPGERVEIPYEGGASIPGILRRPWHTPRPPVVVLMPGLDSVKEELHNYGDDFLKRGIAVLAIDGPGQGEMEFDYPIRHNYEVPIHHVIDYLERRPDVNAARVGLMGVSLGGYYAVRAAAFESRVKAAICLAGAANLAEHWERYPILTKEAFTYRSKSANEAATRAFLQSFNLHGVVEKVTSPLLVIMGRLDRLFPAADSEYLAAAAGGPADLMLFEDGNHVCNNIPYKYRPQQADWMHKQLY